MSFPIPSTLDIDRKLRDDFRRRVKDFGITAETTDPVLAVLFRAFAQQIESVYADTGRIRQSLLEELMEGIHIPQYLARPAQTVVRFFSAAPHAKALQAGTELNGRAASGERLTFSTDATIEVSPASLALALVYENQNLQLLSSVDLSDTLQGYRPTLDPVRVNLGAQPALFLAVENLPETHLSRHALFFELGPGSWPIQEALRSEPWWIFGPEGELDAAGLLRPRRTNSGLYQLEWQKPQTLGAESETGSRPQLPDGFYAGRQFVFPSIPDPARLLCQVPQLLSAPLARICGRDLSGYLATPRVWIKIPMPPNAGSLRTAINGIVLHTVTASNVFCHNQTVDFATDGVSVPVGRATTTPELLVAPLAITGRTNAVFEAGLRPRAATGKSWYELRNGRLTLHPGFDSAGQTETGANVRLWLTNGELGNTIAPGDITGFANAATFDQMRVTHIAAAAGGTNGEDYAHAERRFAEALLTRGRIVTRADLRAAALAYDRRILQVDVHSEIERGPEGLRRMERLWVTLDRDGFTRPELELPALQEGLERSLRERLVGGVVLSVRFAWSEEAVHA